MCSVFSLYIYLGCRRFLINDMIIDSSRHKALEVHLVESLLILNLLLPLSVQGFHNRSYTPAFLRWCSKWSSRNFLYTLQTPERWVPKHGLSPLEDPHYAGLAWYTGSMHAHLARDAAQIVMNALPRHVASVHPWDGFVPMVTNGCLRLMDNQSYTVR